MKSLRLVALGLFLAISLSVQAADHFVSLTGTHVAPFTSWLTAATNIQSAIDAADASDTVWVTNGVYSTGGKVMAGDLTNRIALDKALTVQSVNGPDVTIIQGAWHPITTNGTTAIRCAWLTNNASLVGFTLQGGATRQFGIDATTGGGIWCASTNAFIANCVIQSNAADSVGSAVYQGTVKNSWITKNRTSSSGGTVFGATLTSCTVVSNSNYGVANSRLTNCIVYFNTLGNNSGNVAISYCCITPLPNGAGNISADPQLLADGLHLASTSPCRFAGTNIATGSDLYGQPWATPPAIGCVEFNPAPSIQSQPQMRFNVRSGFDLSIGVDGAMPFTFLWLHDDTPISDNDHYKFSQTTNLSVIDTSLNEAGSYRVVVSNAFGVVTSAVVQVTIRCVNGSGTNPTAPFTTWTTAATNIQDAIDAAQSGDIILVTNGVYSTGGKVMTGDLLNRVALDKAVLVRSVNGPAATIIEGAWDAKTNGPTAVRCVWMTNSAQLSGFTIRKGATRAYQSPHNDQMFGGGIWAASTNALILNCGVSANSASSMGGGAFQATLMNCALVGNNCPGDGFDFTRVGNGGGASGSVLKNCVLTDNYANGFGGGAYNCTVIGSAFRRNSSKQNGSAACNGSLLNCTATGNTTLSPGYAAVSDLFLTNCIVVSNFNRSIISPNYSAGAKAVYSCSSPLLPGVGNIDADPQLLADGVHLAATSPCRNAGTNVISSSDIDGQPWANPPSMGCDEWYPQPLITQQPEFQLNSYPLTLNFFNAVYAGQEPFLFTWLKNDVVLQDGGDYFSATSPNLVISNFNPSVAGDYQLIVSNSFGAVTSAVVRVATHVVNSESVSPLPPYSAWNTAAATIQDAIEIAQDGDIILVTNGVYSTGGKVMEGDLMNRIAVTKPLKVISFNGPNYTIIQGEYDANTNGPTAVRCAWLGNGATLSGFTLQNGATRTTGGVGLQNGGGIWAASAQASVVNCLIYTNAASGDGGGAFQVSLDRCKVMGNSANNGAGIAYGSVKNSLLVNNSAALNGGGVYGSEVKSCTIVANNAKTGAGVYTVGNLVPGNPQSSIIYFNDTQSVFPNDISGAYVYPIKCCIFRYNGGAGNINLDPHFLNDFRLAASSPCRGTGYPLSISGTDIDGEPWQNPPSMGCHEFIADNIKGPIFISVFAPPYQAVEGEPFILGAFVDGQIDRIDWSFGDGSTLADGGMNGFHIWSVAGDYTVTTTAFNLDHPDGVSASTVVHVVPLMAPAVSVENQSGTTFTLGFAAQPGVWYYLERATNLVPPVAWQSIGISYGISNRVEFTDNTATNSMHFYRVRAR